MHNNSIVILSQAIHDLFFESTLISIFFPRSLAHSYKHLIFVTEEQIANIPVLYKKLIFIKQTARHE